MLLEWIYGPRVVRMCQCGFIDCNKGPTPTMGLLIMEEAVPVWGPEDMGISASCPLLL